MSLHTASTSRPRIGLALSGGAVRGLAHIGVLKVLAEFGIHPEIIVGTSVGSLIGAAFAAGKNWQGIAEMATSVFWPNLLNSNLLEQFCDSHLPATFADLAHPFAAVVTSIVDHQTVVIREGRLATAINASCALPYVRRPVVRDGKLFEDGGTTCVLPSEICRQFGADFVIASDVWGYGWCLRVVGLDPVTSQVFPEHYRRALQSTDILIQPPIPVVGYLPGRQAVQAMVSEGETAARQALLALQENQV
ncbi:MAG TPA: patatin-like phospholipase family protein [Acidobacteriota bacterium]|nr:patatin-like phospholipase family protein [Acidobacteriota bacterium]HNH81050.1 patatin-like phospholipase family protein [Acidobacteriota bacterium]